MSKENNRLFDNPAIVRRVSFGLAACLVLLLAMELFIHKHPYFSWEKWFGFYALYGFVACVLLVLVAKYILRPLVKRQEDYYG
jgi:membrane protein YdbS with pleckstrin-like domain